MSTVIFPGNQLTANLPNFFPPENKNNRDPLPLNSAKCNFPEKKYANLQINKMPMDTMRHFYKYTFQDLNDLLQSQYA